MDHELSNVKTKEDEDPSESKKDALGRSDCEGIVSKCHIDDEFGSARNEVQRHSCLNEGASHSFTTHICPFIRFEIIEGRETSYIVAQNRSLATKDVLFAEKVVIRQQRDLAQA